MNDQIRAIALHATAGVVAIALPWWLGSVLGWNSVLVIAIIIGLLIVVGASAVRTWPEGGQLPEPFPVRQSRPADIAPVPPASQEIGPIAIPSLDDAYRFRFSTTVHWHQRPGSPDHDRDRRGVLACEALVNRAVEAARAIPPNDHATAGHRIAAMLSERVMDPRTATEVWASNVLLELVEEDAERLLRLQRIQKDVQLWEQERAHEREIRRYLGDDALKSAGTALVWWLSRNEDDIDGAVNRIPALTRISAVAQNQYVDASLQLGQVEVPDLPPERPIAHHHQPISPKSPVDAAKDLVADLFPDGEDRERASRHLAGLFTTWGRQDLADALRDRNGGSGVPAPTPVPGTQGAPGPDVPPAPSADAHVDPGESHLSTTSTP